MIKKFLVNKIAVTTLCLILLLLFYFLPTQETIDIETINNSELKKENNIYLLDEDNYVSKVTLYFNSNSLEDEVRKRVDYLIEGCVELNNFYPLIPKNTKLNSIKIDKESVYLDFNDELKKVNNSLEEKMIESIVFTITEINGINNIYISVNNKEYKIDKYNYPLTRNIGINKKYDLNSFDNINKTTVFFMKDIDDLEYLVPVTNIVNSEEDSIEIIIKELKSSINSQDNLKSYFDDNIKLLKYSIDNKKMILVFNDSNNISEKVETILANSIFENYDVNEIEISFNDKNESKTIKR
ncbi:MAG: GerMN domain-containing protein [Bacilli bacterium]|nr:GerMN domain-containing protein [Bacilli bacterium]